MTTPLASIIGSGFLVLGPILTHFFGLYAPAVMAVLCAVAYFFGGAIRYNIAIASDDSRSRGRAVDTLEQLSSWALGFAYIITVAYYLNLLGSFAFSMLEVNGDLYPRVLTTAVFMALLVVGWTRGFNALERLEYVSVSIMVAVITGLLFGLAVFFAGKVQSGTLVLNPLEVTGWQAATLVFGLIVTVQGFETSRYLGGTYDPPMLSRSMRWAQLMAAAMYMAYIGLFAYLFNAGDLELTETAIVDRVGVIAAVLPVVLVVAAIAAQFSSAVADTSGAGGLFAEVTGNRVSPRLAYAGVAAIGIAMTWTFNVFEIISHASRAFALYYMLQALVAAVTAGRYSKSVPRVAGFGALAILGAMILAFGRPVEG